MSKYYIIVFIFLLSSCEYFELQEDKISKKEFIELLKNKTSELNSLKVQNLAVTDSLNNKKVFINDKNIILLENDTKIVQLQSNTNTKSGNFSIYNDNGHKIINLGKGSKDKSGGAIWINDKKGNSRVYLGEYTNTWIGGVIAYDTNQKIYASLNKKQQRKQVKNKIVKEAPRKKQKTAFEIASEEYQNAGNNKSSRQYNPCNNFKYKLYGTEEPIETREGGYEYMYNIHCHGEDYSSGLLMKVIGKYIDDYYYIAGETYQHDSEYTAAKSACNCN